MNEYSSESSDEDDIHKGSTFMVKYPKQVEDAIKLSLLRKKSAISQRKTFQPSQRISDD